MSVKQPLLTTLLFFLFLNTHSQDSAYKVANTPFLRFIRDSRFDGVQFVTFAEPFAKRMIDFRNSFLGKNGQCLLILNGELHIQVPNTGIIYKATGSREQDSLIFVRIDQTELLGYNINSFSFVHNKMIYNLGGYGFWHWNGQLRKFSTKLGQWELEPLNREIPVSSLEPGTHFWKSPGTNLVYTFSYIGGNEAVKPQISTQIVNVDSVIKLDLGTDNWTVLGKLNPKLKPGVFGPSFRAGLDSGILVENLGILQYLNLIDNSVSISTDRELFHIFSFTGKSFITWNKNDKLFYSDVKTGFIDSISLSSIKFTRTNDKIYENDSNFLSQLGYGGGLLIFAVIGWGLRKKMFKLQPLGGKGEVSNKDLISPYTSREVFTEVEKALLKLLFDNMTFRSSTTSTDEVNRILGVGNKSVDMQKRKRSDIIKSINSKYQLLNPDKEIELIDRAKSGVDARLYEYSLNANLDFLKEDEV